MKSISLCIGILFTSLAVNANNLKSDEMCQQYLLGITQNITLAENVGMHALRVSLNRINDEHPQYSVIASEIAFGTALSEEGHRRTGQYINAMCTQDGTVFIDVVYKVLLTESKRLSNAQIK